jgi:CheY-like chemotaxis protein
MSGDLVLLRILVVSASAQHRDILREGAVLARIPLEVIEADGATAASKVLAGGNIDIVFVDGAMAQPARNAVATAARAAASKPFVVLVTATKEDAERVGADAMADAIAVKPATRAEAANFAERCSHVRLPNRVLLVDDSSTMRSIVRKILAASRFRLQVDEAAEGIDALKQIGSGKFDVVILDHNMPGLNGIETLAEIKRQSPRIGVVMMTSTPNEAIAERARAAGAAAFLSKPFYPADIDAALLTLCGMRAPPRS